MPKQVSSRAERIHLETKQDDEYETLLEKVTHYLPTLAPTLYTQRD